MVILFALFIGSTFLREVGCKERPFKVLNPASEEKIRTADVLFWDLDHTLYPQKTGVYSKKIVISYIMNHLKASELRANLLYDQYYRKFSGQIIEGLREDFGVDPIQFEAWIDRAAGLLKVLHPDRTVIETLKRVTARNWVFTNSGWPHASRTIHALGLQSLIEGVIYLDYRSKNPLIMKPSSEAFEKAMEYAQVSDPKRCYIVDDFKINVFKACQAGWNSAHFCEPFYCVIENPRLLKRSETCSDPPKLSNLAEVEIVFPELFE